MNSKRVQQLVIIYKQIHKDSKKAKNIIWNELAREYNDIFEGKYLLKIDKYYKQDFKQFLYLDLLEQIERYNPNNSKNCSFDTFFYYRLMSSRDRFFKELKEIDDNHIERVVNKFNPESQLNPELLYNLDIDITKILTKKELLLLSAFINRECRYSPTIEALEDKLRDYINGNIS